MRITSKLYFDKYVAVKNEKTLYEPEIGRKQVENIAIHLTLRSETVFENFNKRENGALKL